MVDIRATTTVNFDIFLGSIEDYLELDVLTSPDPEEALVEVRCTDVNAVRFEYYQCKFIKNKLKYINFVQDIVIDSGKADLTYHPESIEKVEFILNPDNFSFGDINIVGKNITLSNFAVGKFCMIRVSYTYKCRHLTLKYSGDGGVIFTKIGDEKAKVKGVLRARYKELAVVSEVSFSYNFPALSVESTTEDEGTMLKIYSTSFSSHITYKVIGATILGSREHTEDVAESVNFTGGYGYTTKGIMSINNVTFSLNQGSISMDISEFTNNKLKFVPSSSGFGGSVPASLEAVAMIEYTTKVLDLRLGNTTGDISYEVKDEFGNIVTGVISASDAEKSKDISIKVYDYLTSFPIANATVKLAGKTAKTDSNGLATFSSLTPGTYSILVSASGYFPNDQDHLINEHVTI